MDFRPPSSIGQSHATTPRYPLGRTDYTEGPQDSASTKNFSEGEAHSATTPFISIHSHLSLSRPRVP